MMKAYGLIVAVLLVVTGSFVLADECFSKYTALVDSKCDSFDPWPWAYVQEFYSTVSQMYNDSASEQAYTTFYNEFCSAKLDMFNCFDAEIKPQLIDCASNIGPVQEVFDVIIYYAASLKYLCANSAHLMTELFKGDGVTCLIDLNMIKCPVSEEGLDQQRWFCRTCDSIINCRPYYKECVNKNTVNIWIDIHIAAKTALGC